MSRDLERARSAAAAGGAQAARPAFDDLDAMLADPDLDAVIIATPDKLHAAQTIASARAGKHVLVEKPMATDREDAQAMIEACSAAGVRLGVAYHLRWHRGLRALAGKAAAGDFGELRHIRVRWTWLAEDAQNWRARPEVGRWWGLAGVGTHCLDLIRWMMVPRCGEVVRVQSLITRAKWKGPHDETALVCLEFESGATAEFCTSVLFESPSQLELFGTRGRIWAEGVLGPHGAGSIELDGERFEHPVEDPYVGEIRDFVAAVREGKEPEVGGIEGARNVELLLRASPSGPG